LRPDMRRQITALGLEGTKGWRGQGLAGRAGGDGVKLLSC
jgi:hypothetical protein